MVWGPTYKCCMRNQYVTNSRSCVGGDLGRSAENTLGKSLIKDVIYRVSPLIQVFINLQENPSHPFLNMRCALNTYII